MIHRTNSKKNKCKKKGFIHSLEQKAKKASRHIGNKSPEPISLLEQDIALTLEHIKKKRTVHQRQLHDLLDIECFIDTELMQMEDRTSRYSAFRFPERLKLQRELLKIESERRTERRRHTETLQELFDRLHELIKQRDMLRG